MTTEKNLTPSEREEFEAYKAEKDFEATGIREVVGSLKCPACLHTQPEPLTETRIRRYLIHMDGQGNITEDRSMPPESETSLYQLVNERPLPIHDCEDNEYKVRMIVLEPNAQSAFVDEDEERVAKNDPGRRRFLGKSDTAKLATAMEDAFQKMFERAKEGK